MKRLLISYYTSLNGAPLKPKWRIIAKFYTNTTDYILQKRFLGFLWWYNPDNIDGAITGVYNTLEEAQEAYKRKTHKVTKQILSVDKGCN